jgi:hypothetical protein
MSKVSNKSVICRMESVEPVKKEEIVEIKKPENSATIENASAALKSTTETPSSGTAEKRGKYFMKKKR